MEVRIIKALWGLEGSYREQFKRISEAGYLGIEAPLPPKEQEIEFKELLQEYKFDYLAQVVTSGNHADSFANQVQRAAAFHPRLIVSHSARDAMSFEEQHHFFEAALAAEKEVGVPVGHETHRSRAMFTPWTTAKLLEAFPDLRITADFSHWCCVTETMLEDYLQDVELAMNRVIHIHARVGYTQGPQVPDPSAPEYAGELTVFDGWWERILEIRRNTEFRITTVTPEFGPPGYMHTLPHTNQPVASQWEVNEWMAQRFASNARAKGYQIKP